MTVVDYAFPPHPGLDSLRAAGVTGVIRYLAYRTPSTLPKIIGLAEYAALTLSGFDITLNWEYDEHDFVNAGFDAATAAREAQAQARALGHPDHLPIYFSVDFDATAGQWPTIRDRLRAVGAVLGPDRVGVYGPWDVLTWAARDRAASWFWQAGMSGSWSGGRNVNPWPGAHLRQRRSVVIGDADCDISEVIQPNYGQNGATVGVLDEIVPATGNRPLGVCISDMFNGEQGTHSGYGPGQTTRQAQLNRIEAGLLAVQKTLGQATPLVLTAAQLADLKASIVAAVTASHDALTADDEPVIGHAVAAELAKVFVAARTTG